MPPNNISWYSIISHYIYYNKWLYFYIKTSLYIRKRCYIFAILYRCGVSCIYTIHAVYLYAIHFLGFYFLSKFARHASYAAALLREYPRDFDIIAHILYTYIWYYSILYSWCFIVRMSLKIWVLLLLSKWEIKKFLKNQNLLKNARLTSEPKY